MDMYRIEIFIKTELAKVLGVADAIKAVDDLVRLTQEACLDHNPAQYRDKT